MTGRLPYSALVQGQTHRWCGSKHLPAPSGHLRIAQHFSAGDMEALLNRSPVGTAELCRHLRTTRSSAIQPSLRDYRHGVRRPTPSVETLG